MEKRGSERNTVLSNIISNNSFTPVFDCILNSSSENDSSEADSLLSDESFSSGRNSRQGDSENNTHRSRRKKRKVCWVFWIILIDCCLFSIATSSLGFSRFLLVNEKTLGTRLIRLIVKIKSVNFALVFQVFFYCDVDVGKTQSFKTAFCTLPNVCLIKFPGLFDGLKGARYDVWKPGVEL